MNRATGRIVNHDVRNKDFPIAALLPKVVKQERKIWKVGYNFPLDQGSDGACVGFGWAGYLASQPDPIDESYASAMDLYTRARLQDVLMNVHSKDGASLLAGAKAMQNNGVISSYHWAHSLEDIVNCVCSIGPVVVGTRFYDSMEESNLEGLLTVDTHTNYSGHCYLLFGYWPGHLKFGDCFIMLNSWGTDWGVKGMAFIKKEDVRLLTDPANHGEACLAVETKKKQQHKPISIVTKATQSARKLISAVRS